MDSFGTQLKRGLRKRCPRCGAKGIFSGYFSLRDHCPSCSYSFERESGYWVGAMTVNMAFAEVMFLVAFLAVVLATMPDIEWGPLLIVGLVTNGLVPVILYPYSKSVWMAFDLYFHRLDPNDAEGGA